MPGERIEWRTVCAQFGSRGHASHQWPKRDEAKATQAVIDANHHAEKVGHDPDGTPRMWYLNEAPYKVQSRRVEAWSDHEQ